MLLGRWRVLVVVECFMGLIRPEESPLDLAKRKPLGTFQRTAAVKRGGCGWGGSESGGGWLDTKR